MITTIDPVKQIIARIPAWIGVKDIQIEPIGGLTNRDFRLTIGGMDYVLRISGQNTEQLGINRKHELAALRSAAEAGIGPEVVVFLLPEGHLVTRWVEGHHLRSDELRTSKNVRLLTETVKRIHTLPANGSAFSPFHRVYTFLETAQNYQVPIPSEFPTDCWG